VSERPIDPEVREALHEFQQYLSDRVPPLMMADEMALLLQHPPQLIAAEIHSWTAAQYRGHGSTIPLSDYLYHAAKKVHAIGEFNLVPADKLNAYVNELSLMLLEVCPEADRPNLRQNLMLLGQAQTTLSAPVDVVYRQAGSETPLASTVRSTGGVVGAGIPVGMSEAAAEGLRRFTRLLEEVSQMSASGDLPRAQAQSQVVASALTETSSPAEMDAYLRSAEESGIDTQPRTLLRMLAGALPPWAVPFSTEAEGDLSGPAEAMRKVVTMAHGAGEGARRFREMVKTAIDQFNEGSLARSVTIFELAERIIAERHVPDLEVRSIRSIEHESLDAERLRKHIESKDSHFLLRRVLSFFTAYGLQNLFEELRLEQKRERRRAILALLEVYGIEAREEAMKMLDTLVTQKPDNESHFVARNLVYLLHRIPRPSDGTLEKELDILAGLSSTTYKAIVVREAISALAQIKHDRAERILLTRLRELEASLASPGLSRYTVQETKQLIDRIVAALGRIGTTLSLSGIVEHALSPGDPSGEARARISALATHDLALHPPVLQRVLETIRAELPKKMLGFFGNKKAPNVSKLIEALGATSAATARELLEEISEKHPETDFAATAENVLDSMGATPRPSPQNAPTTPTLSGDVEVFGLPNLLQNLAEMRLTGLLSLIDQEDRTVSNISLVKGKIVRCQSGPLAGKEALFQIFELSRPASFAFMAKKEKEEAEPLEALEVAPLVFEALRRHDELNRARLLIPPAATLTPTGAKPQPHPKESDAQLVREVWLRAISGRPPAKWEGELAADSYRIWRLLEHWIRSGALQVNRG
jgi:hypothetical protein